MASLGVPSAINFICSSSNGLPSSSMNFSLVSISFLSSSTSRAVASLFDLGEKNLPLGYFFCGANLRGHLTNSTSHVLNIDMIVICNVFFINHTKFCTELIILRPALDIESFFLAIPCDGGIITAQLCALVVVENWNVFRLVPAENYLSSCF